MVQANEGSDHHNQDNPEIIDDWPLHPAGDINTKVTIGACWQGMASYKVNVYPKAQKPYFS